MNDLKYQFSESFIWAIAHDPDFEETMKKIRKIVEECKNLGVEITMAPDEEYEEVGQIISPIETPGEEANTPTPPTQTPADDMYL